MEPSTSLKQLRVEGSKESDEYAGVRSPQPRGRREHVLNTHPSKGAPGRETRLVHSNCPKQEPIPQLWDAEERDCPEVLRQWI